MIFYQSSTEKVLILDIKKSRRHKQNEYFHFVQANTCRFPSTAKLLSCPGPNKVLLEPTVIIGETEGFVSLIITRTISLSNIKLLDGPCRVYHVLVWRYVFVVNPNQVRVYRQY